MGCARDPGRDRGAVSCADIMANRAMVAVPLECAVHLDALRVRDHVSRTGDPRGRNGDGAADVPRGADQIGCSGS